MKRRRETDRQRVRRRNEREREGVCVCVLLSQSSMDPESYGGFSWDGTTSSKQASSRCEIPGRAVKIAIVPCFPQVLAADWSADAFVCLP